METRRNSPIVVADSSGLVSLLFRDDRNHLPATKASQDLAATEGRLIIPADVFAETMNVLGRFSHQLAHEGAAFLRDTQPFAILETGEKLRRSALARFLTQPAAVSYTDCVVMAVADEYQTSRIFGFDQAFARNGYAILGQEAEAA